METSARTGAFHLQTVRKLRTETKSDLEGTRKTKQRNQTKENKQQDFFEECSEQNGAEQNGILSRQFQSNFRPLVTVQRAIAILG
jgi:hypothetical protein